MGVLVLAVAVATGLPTGGSVLLGAAVAAVGLTFTSLTAVAAQVFDSVRAGYGSVALVLGAAYALRAAGDAGHEALAWLSPIGWGQRTFPYAGDRWWPLLPPLATAVLLMIAAVVPQDRRDFGAGLVQPGSDGRLPPGPCATPMRWPGGCSAERWRDG
ncbi:hypothetical protein [Krasilnikovia cinnamomea]|uniref:hypothetical protein n=1 Tax=Krasilnikovia cinnamomea TaxID=349313 RepID=UPI00102AC26B|nr:hypothetical protein [Krasilnikovia cinnamomea]